VSDPAKPTVVLLYGDDELALEERLAELVGRLGDPATATINISRFDAARLDLEGFASQLMAAPFLSPRRMIVLDLGPATGRRPDVPARVFDLLESMPETSIVVALERVDYEASQRRPRNARPGAGGSPPGASAFFRWVQDHPGRAVARQHRSPRGPTFERWAVERARRHGAEIDGRAAALLGEVTAEDTRLADQELRKLADYVNRERPISAADLELLTPFHTETDVFGMVDAIGGRQGSKAMRTMQHLLAEEDPRYVFTMIVRQFRLLLLARDAVDHGLSPQQVLAESPHRLPSFVADKVGRQALGFSLEQLSEIYRELLALDIASKSGRADLTLGLESLVATLAA
jgi:DNA polymerase-3 subunit delta